MQKQVLRGLHEEHVANETIRYDDGTEWLLGYYLQTFECPGGETLYGLKVDKSTPDGVLVESEETFATTDNKDEALAMVEAFARGTVPPSVLLELVDEWDWEWYKSRPTALA